MSLQFWMPVCFHPIAQQPLASLLAYSLSPARQRHRVGIIGTGRIGFYTAYLLHRWLKVNQVNVYSPDQTIAQNFQQLAEAYMPALDFRFMAKKEVIRTSDALFAASCAAHPILNADNGDHLKFISSVGADADNRSEIHESLINTHQIITDSIQSMLFGDMRRWKAMNLISDEDVTELKTFVSSTNTLPPNALFISTGVAVQEAIISRFILDEYNPQTVGPAWRT